MKLVDTKDNKFVDANPATLEPGTPIPASSMNAIQDEIANVITGYGLTIDESNDAQMKAALDKNFAPIISPTLTGIPLTSNPDGTVDNQIATVDYVNQKALQATVGFTPVQQSGGTDQGANKVYVGADSTDATQARIQIDQTDLGKIVFQQEDDNTYGISKIGFSNPSRCLAFYDTGNKAWHYSYTTDYIDGKAYISSLPDGNNLKVSDIIWNSSSSLPALYYGTDNSVAYLATEDWSNGRYIKTAESDVDSFVTDITVNKQTGLPYIQSEAYSGSLQPYLGFTPVQQGGGSGQGPNKVILGWATDGSGLKCQVDSTDEGFFSFRGEIECFAFGAITYNSSSVVASFSFLPSHDGYLKLDYNLGQASNNPVANLEVTGSGFNIIGGVDNNSGTNLRVGSSLYSVVAGQQVVVNMTGTYTASGSQTDVGGTAIYIPK